MNLPLELMGKQGKCPTCSAVVTIAPTQEPGEAEKPPGEVPAEAVSAVEQPPAEPAPIPVPVEIEDPSPAAAEPAPPATTHPAADTPPPETAVPTSGRMSTWLVLLAGAAIGAAITASLFLLLGGS